VAGSSCLFV